MAGLSHVRGIDLSGHLYNDLGRGIREWSQTVRFQVPLF